MKNHISFVITLAMIAAFFSTCLHLASNAISRGEKQEEGTPKLSADFTLDSYTDAKDFSFGGSDNMVLRKVTIDGTEYYATRSHTGYWQLGPKVPAKNEAAAPAVDKGR